MRTPTPPIVRRTLAAASTVYVLSALMYVAGGCAGGGSSAKDGSALDSYVQGVRAYQKGDTTAAMTNFQDAVNKKNDLVMARSMLGDLYRSKSDYEAARVQYEAVARLDPYEYVHHYHLGLVYQLLNRLQDAAVSYLAALDLRPTDAASNMQLGTVYFSLNRPAEAMKYGQRAVELDPKSAAAWVNFALILDANNQFTQAEDAYRKSLDLDSGNTTTRSFLGENLIAQKKYAAARSVFSELVKVEDSEQARTLLGNCYRGEKNYGDAMIQYRAALKLNPIFYRAMNGIGDVNIAEYNAGAGLLDDSKRKAAVEAWQQSLSINRAQADVMAKVQQHSKATMFPQ